MHKFYEQVNLPPIPENLIEIEKINLTSVNTSYNIEHTKNNIPINSCVYQYGMMPHHHPLTTWLKTFLKDISFTFFQKQINTVKDGYSTHIVHSDIRRKKALNYILDEGGSDVITSWYQEIGKPLYRNKLLGNQQSDLGPVYYENLELLDSAKFKKGNWYLIDTSVLHDVDFIETERCSISISILDKDFKL
jgi:hypothetical protein